jgi:hypothetical protein
MQTPTFFVERSPSVDAAGAAAALVSAVAAGASGAAGAGVPADVLAPQPMSDAAIIVEAITAKNFFMEFLPSYYSAADVPVLPTSVLKHLPKTKNIENSFLNLENSLNFKMPFFRDFRIF